METIKVLEILNKCKGYDYALMTTFNFDIGFFERFVLNRLYDNGTKKVSIFVDSKELVKSLNDVSNSSLGRKYVVHPIEMNGAFHPKLLLLLGQDKARLFVASANLTANGYLRNNEIFNEFVFDSDHAENGKVIVAAIDFFFRINELSYKQDESLFNEIKQLPYFGRKVKNENLYLLNNLDKPIIKQVKELVLDVRSIDIAVPFYDNELSAVVALSESYPDAKINLFVQNRKSRFPVDKRLLKCITKLNIYNGFSETNNAFYHGKVFKFETKDASYILYGSANCTQNAFIKSFTENSNIECDVLEKGASCEFNSFFDSFNCVYEKLQCEQITYSGSNNNNFYFKYGILGKKLTLYFGIKQDYSFSAVSNGVELDAYIIDDMVVVEMTSEQLPYTNVFEITFKYNNTSESINCWYLNPELLEFNRLKEASDVIYSFDFDNNEDRYLEDKMAILRETSLTPDEIQAEIDVINVINATNSNQATDELDSGEDDGIISYVIPEANYLQKYNKYKRINSIRTGYISTFYRRFSYGETVAASTSNNTVVQTETNIRVPVSQEKRFKRFVIKRLKEFTSTEYTSLCGYSHYLSVILVFISVFEKYAIDSSGNGLFDIEDVIYYKVLMLSRLLEKARAEDLYPDDEETLDTVVLTLQAILENHFITNYPDSYRELDNDVLLNYLNYLFDLRSSYEKYALMAVDVINEQNNRVDEDSALRYIDDLFGYKDEPRLKDIIYKDYGEDAKIEIDSKNNHLKINSVVNDIVNHMKVKPSTLKEVRNYCKTFEIDQFCISIVNGKPRSLYKPTLDPVKKIDYKIEVNSGRIEQCIERYSGRSVVETIR